MMATRIILVLVDRCLNLSCLPKHKRRLAADGFDFGLNFIASSQGQPTYEAAAKLFVGHGSRTPRPQAMGPLNRTNTNPCVEVDH